MSIKSDFFPPFYRFSLKVLHFILQRFDVDIFSCVLEHTSLHSTWRHHSGVSAGDRVWHPPLHFHVPSSAPVRLLGSLLAQSDLTLLSLLSLFPFSIPSRNLPVHHLLRLITDYRVPE